MNGLKAVYCKEMKKIFKEPKMIFSVFAGTAHDWYLRSYSGYGRKYG